MSIKTAKVFRNMPARLYVVKDRYWHHSEVLSVGGDMTVERELVPYEGLGITYSFECDMLDDSNKSAPVIHIKEGELPDHTLFKGSDVCLKEMGKKYLISKSGYYNFIQVGNVVVNDTTGIASGFNSQSYLRCCPHCLVSDGQSFEICMRVKPTTLGKWQYWLNGPFFWGLNTSNKMVLWLSSNGNNASDPLNGVSGSTVFEKNVFYDVKFTYEDGVYKMFSKKDGADAWVEEVSVSSSLVFPDFHEFSVGLNLERTSEYLYGEVALSSFVIYINGQQVWSAGSGGVTLIEGGLSQGVIDDRNEHMYNMFYKNGKVCLDLVQKKNGYMWVGQAYVSWHSDNVAYSMGYSLHGKVVHLGLWATNFSQDNYLLSDKKLPAGPFFSPNLRFISRVRMSGNVSDVQYLCCDESMVGHGFGIANGKWRLANGNVFVGGTVEAYAIYWVQLVQLADGGTVLYYLKDNGSYSLSTLPEVSAWASACTVSGALFDTSGQKIRIGTSSLTPTQSWGGELDLEATRVDVGGVSVVGMSWETYWKALYCLE